MRSVSLLLIMCLILESCSINWTGGSRSPSSDLKINELNTSLNLFKTKVSGSIKDKNCSKEQLDQDFNRLIAHFKKDSCSESEFTLDKQEFLDRACPKIKVEGYLDRIARKIIQSEKEKKDLINFKNNIDTDFLKLYQEALGLQKKVSNLLISGGIPVDSKIELITNYVDTVLLPFREMVIIKRAYQSEENDGNEYLSNLILVLSNSFIDDLNPDQIGSITMGPNPSSTPFYLELKKINDSYVLQFSASDIMRKDVISLLKAPTAKNYLMALKWMTLHMMLSQVFVYDTILETKSPLTIPNSCQNHFNGNLPSTFKFKFEEGEGDKFIENILSSHGLIFNQEDSSYLDYYLENVNKDPTKDGYSSIVPFENYKNARRGLTNNSNQPTDAQLDDQVHFQSILNLKIQEAFSVFRDVAKNKSSRTKEKYSIVYNGSETFQKIIGTFSPDEVAEYKSKSGVTVSLYPGKQNLSPFILDLMKQYGVEDYSQLISPRIKNKFLNKRISIEFPSMYSSPVWRDWSLKTLADIVHRYRDVPSTSPIHNVLNMACMPGYYVNNRDATALREICLKGNKLENLDKFLSEFRSGESYIPTRRLEEKQFQSIYPMLSRLWDGLRENTDLLLEAKPLELDFLLEQMHAGNPWARLKLGYLLAIDQLEYQKEGVPPVYQFNGLWYSADVKAQCDFDLIESKYTKIKKAGEIIGLNKPITYNFAGKFLSPKERISIWSNIVGDFEKRNAQLFSVVQNKKSYYQSIEDISYKTILSKKQALEVPYNLSNRSKKEIERLSKATEGVLGEFFINLYNMKGQPDKQKELFEKFSKVNGIDNTFKLKLNFLALDEAYKRPIYKDLVKQAALSRKLQIIDQLNTFCSMDVDNPKEFKNIFYSTTKVQNELNQLAGLPSVPEETMKKINDMTPDESRDMWWGIGSGVLGIAAIVVGGACTAVSGGICAPLGGSMAIAGLASLGIQVKLTSNEINRKIESIDNEIKVKQMEDLGFANIGSSDEVHRSVAWSAVEALSIFPLIGIAAKSATLGPKLVYTSTQSMLRQTGKTAFKAAAKTVAQEEEVKMAQYILGVESVSKNLGIDSKAVDSVRKEISKIKLLYQAGEIDLETMLRKIAKTIDPIKKMKTIAKSAVAMEYGRVILNESKEQVDAQTAKVVTQYFSDNPDSMYRVIRTYSGERLSSAIRAMAEINNTQKIGNRIPIYRNVKNWFTTMRNESLAKNASKILRIEKELQALPNKPGVLQNYILKNIEDLTDIFIDIPMRKRELPYMIQAQGIPLMNLMGGKKIPILSLMSEGQTLKKIFASRARLVFETYKNSARASLKLGHYVKAETTFAVFNSFQYSVADLAGRVSNEESKKIINEYAVLQTKLAEQLYHEFSSKGSRMEFEAFKKLVFNPINILERAKAEVIWESVPADHLFNMKEMNEIAHKAAKELSNYNDIDSFERYLSALKVLTINRNSAAID